MSTPPSLPILVDQRKIDESHLKLLSILHYVIAGLSLLGIGFLFMHYFMFDMMMNKPEIWEGQDGTPPPPELFEIFIYFYIVAGFFILAGGLTNFLSARFITQRKNRTFSLIVAGLNCLQFPFGTALGVFTFVVLLRKTVQDTYENRLA